MSSLILLLVTCIALLISCSPDYAGGTADTGNAKVAAVIYTSDGKRAAGVPVVCCPVDYLADFASDTSLTPNPRIIETMTDDSGFFAIDSIGTGDYIIEINDRESSVTSIRVGVSEESDSTISLNDTLKPYASLQGNAGQVTDSSLKRYLLIYGLDRCLPISADGSFAVNDLPDGNFDLLIVADKEDWVPCKIDSVTFSSAQTVSIPFAGWDNSCIISLNTTSSGADIKENVYSFPVLIRLSESDFDFSSATDDGSDCIFIDSQNKQLRFEIEQWDITKKTAIIWVSLDTVYGNSDKQTITMLWGNRNNVSTSAPLPVFDSSYGFLGCYHFNGNLKNAALDAYNGIDSSSYDTSEGVIGNGRFFNGFSSFFRVESLPDRPSGSISCWFKLVFNIDQYTSKTQGIWGKKIADDHDFTLSLLGSDFFPGTGTGAAGNLIAKLENPEGGEYLASKTSNFFANVWYFVSWSWGDGSNTLYINGVLENSISEYRAVSGESDDEIGRSPYDVSNVPDGIPGYFYGTLDEFRIDSRARSADWVKLSFMNQRPDQKFITIIKP